MYTGLLMPDGRPPQIQNNGQRAQDADNFELNQTTYLMYLWRLLDIAMSVFQWNDLPKGVDERMLEMWLVRDGFCCFFHDEDLKYGDEGTNAPEGYAVLQCMVTGKWDMYNYPTDRRAYSVSGLNIPLTEENSVIVFNDYLRVPMFMTLDLYAQRLANIDRTIDVNVAAQKCPKIIRCDEKTKLSFKNLAKQVDGNQYWILADKSLDLSNLEVLDTSAPFVSNELQVLKHQLWNEALTYLGVENVNTDKRERLITDEVASNMGDVSAQRFTRLNARRQAAEKINELFGLDVTVDFRSSTYMKVIGGTTLAMPEEGDTGLPATYNANDGSVIEHE